MYLQIFFLLSLSCVDVTYPQKFTYIDQLITFTVVKWIPNDVEIFTHEIGQLLNNSPCSFVQAVPSSTLSTSTFMSVSVLIQNFPGTISNLTQLLIASQSTTLKFMGITSFMLALPSPTTPAPYSKDDVEEYSTTTLLLGGVFSLLLIVFVILIFCAFGMRKQHHDQKVRMERFLDPEHHSSMERLQLDIAKNYREERTIKSLQEFAQRMKSQVAALERHSYAAASGLVEGSSSVVLGSGSVGRGGDTLETALLLLEENEDLHSPNRRRARTGGSFGRRVMDEEEYERLEELNLQRRMKNVEKIQRIIAKEKRRLEE
eukprot:PhF_6_TR1550/c0_g1_i1/m.2822